MQNRGSTGICTGIPYIGLQKNKVGMATIEMVRASFESYTKKEIKKS